MEVDKKIVVGMIVSLFLAGIVGSVTSEISTSSALVSLETKITKLEERVSIRIQEGKDENAAIRAEMKEMGTSMRKDVNDRLDRLDARKADR